MPVFLGLDLLDWLLAGGVAYVATSAVSGAAQGVETGVSTATNNVTQAMITPLLIGAGALLLFMALKK